MLENVRLVLKSCQLEGLSREKRLRLTMISGVLTTGGDDLGIDSSADHVPDMEIWLKPIVVSSNNKGIT
jgi:hypothetical protein